MKKKKLSPLRFVVVLTVLGAMAVLFYFGGLSLLKTLYPLDYSDYVEFEAEENNLSPYFVYAVIECESGFDPKAVSHTGAVGLMQIMPDTFDWINMRTGMTFDFSQASEPAVSVKYGCYLYGYLLEKYEKEEVAVAAYHAGIGSVDKWLQDDRYSSDGKTLKDIPFPTTKKYVNKVIKTKNIYEKLYDRKDA